MVINIIQNRKDDWITFEQNSGSGVLMELQPENALKIRSGFFRYASLPELAALYLDNFSFFNSANFFYKQGRESINILTDSNEILGIDLEGRVYNKNEKLIVNTHGVYVNSEHNKKNSVEKNILCEKEFGNLLLGILPGGGQNKPLPVYREEHLGRLKNKNIMPPCITVLRADKYLKNPADYCNELEYIQLESGFKKNGLLISRTLQEPTKLMEFIKEDVTYFRQISPLIEPLILSKCDALFDKYAYRVMPLILSGGEITKDAKDAVDLFNERKSENKSMYIVTLFNQ